MLFQYCKHVYIAKNGKTTIYLIKFKGNNLYAWNCRCTVSTFPYTNIDSTHFKILMVKEMYVLFLKLFMKLAGNIVINGKYFFPLENYLTHSYIL